MKVAIIGTGHSGLALGPLLAEAGHRSVYGTEHEDRMGRGHPDSRDMRLS